MYTTAIYKKTSETQKLEKQLMDQLEKMPTELRKQLVSKSQFDIFLKNVPDAEKERCKKYGIQLGGNPEFVIRCASYE